MPISVDSLFRLNSDMTAGRRCEVVPKASFLITSAPRDVIARSEATRQSLIADTITDLRSPRSPSHLAGDLAMAGDLWDNLLWTVSLFFVACQATLTYDYKSDWQSRQTIWRNRCKIIYV